MEICFATQNSNKLNEIQQLLPESLSLKSLKDLGFRDDIPETGMTLEENAEIKARFCYQKFRIPSFADDTGLEVEALNGEPGVYSARYAGITKDSHANMKLLMHNLEGIDNRTAQFRTVICYIDPSGITMFFQGIVKGKILGEMRGEKGFGYDPIFVPEGYGHTFAEMSLAEKNKISHRSIAFGKFVPYLISGEV